MKESSDESDFCTGSLSLFQCTGEVRLPLILKNTGSSYCILYSSLMQLHVGMSFTMFTWLTAIVYS